MSAHGKQDTTFINCSNSLRFFIVPLLLAERLSRHGLLNLVRMYTTKCTNLKNLVIKLHGLLLNRNILPSSVLLIMLKLRPSSFEEAHK
jgi:hypothetical protein